MLVSAGSSPVTPIMACSSVVERLTVNQNVVGSSPTVRACPDVDANFLLSRSHYLGRMLLKGE